jgi:hypothetical protein
MVHEPDRQDDYPDRRRWRSVDPARSMYVAAINTANICVITRHRDTQLVVPGAAGRQSTGAAA